MANYFKESEDLPILSSWITQGFVIDRPYVLEAIETDRQALEKDTQLSTIATFGSIASGCLMLALGGITAPMIIPIAMIGAAGLTAWNSDCAKSDRELEAKFLRAYPTVFDRLAQRISEGETVSRIASDYGLLLKAYRRADRTALASLVDAPGQAIAPTPAIVTVVEPTPIEVASFASKDAIEPRDIATDLGNNPQSALIFGTPGAGKGMTISNAIRTLRSKLPNLTIMMVDPKGDKKEKGYWESQVDIFEARALLKTSPRSSAEWMLRCVEKFQNLDGPKLLIWDELFASITVLKGQNVPKGEDAFPCLTEFQQFISLNLSLGPSSGVWVWGMSQSANLSDLGLTSGGLSTTRIIALISPDNVGAVEGYLATKAITAPKGGMTYLDELMNQSPVGRACYDGKTKRWYPVAKLQNHSGFDRDNADWNTVTPIGIIPPSVEPTPTNITGTWREDFAKNLPPGLSESDFKARYDLEKSLREPWQAVEPIEVETIAVVETNSRSAYDDWQDYPVHQAILVYLQGKADKTDRNVYDSIKKKIDSEQWESIPGTDNMAKLKNVLSYLTNTKKVLKVSPNSYSAAD